MHVLHWNVKFNKSFLKRTLIYNKKKVFLTFILSKKRLFKLISSKRQVFLFSSFLTLSLFSFNLVWLIISLGIVNLTFFSLSDNFCMFSIKVWTSGITCFKIDSSFKRQVPELWICWKKTSGKFWIQWFLWSFSRKLGLRYRILCKLIFSFKKKKNSKILIFFFFWPQIFSNVLKIWNHK